MIRQRRVRIHDIPSFDLMRVVEALCHESVKAFPVYECVKIYARVAANGEMTYARHRNDLGTHVVPAYEIVSRFKNEVIREVTAEALQLVESQLLQLWPFSPGSSSWIQLEILDKDVRVNGPINRPTIVVRKALRLSSAKDSVETSSTPLIERMFSKFEKSLPSSLGRFEVVYSPSFILKNIAGSGVVTEARDNIESDIPANQVAEDVACSLIKANMPHEPFMSPGFSFFFEGEEYQVTSRTFKGDKRLKDEKKVLPIPIVGILK